jgi:peptidyl-prolyl cis-trans isomerase SurA
MKYFLIVSVLFWALPISLQAQGEEVLMTVDGKPVYVSEFKQVYNKNLDLVVESERRDIDGYLQLFKNYKLKLTAAEELGLEERADLRKELEGYKNQLAENLMMDSPVTEALVQEAYDHMVNEVQASHIMVALPANSRPADTLRAYKKIEKIRKQLINGADFEKLARAESEDPSVVNNGGALGWFSAFKMVYPFEKAAYNTPVGEISPIVRSGFGYHVLKTTAKRKSRGEVEVAHIMLALHRNEGVNDQERRIQEIYQKLQQGESFDLLARKYSEDAKSARMGGVLDRFAAGGLSSPIFEEQAFALENPGDISAPFTSEVGWHIVKLIAKYPIESLKALTPYIEAKIKSDSRSRLVETALDEKLQRELNPWENDTLIQHLEMSSLLAKKLEDQTPLLIIKKDTVPVSQFAEFLANDRWFGNAQKTDTLVLKSEYKRFKYGVLRNYYKMHLAENNVEFAQITKEYREGILLFALMEDKIWNPAKEDSVGLAGYFAKHREAYERPEKYDVLVVNSTDLASAKKARKLLKKGHSNQEIKEDLNTDGKVHIFCTKALVDEDDALLPEGYEVKPGVSKIYEGPNEFTVVDLKKTVPSEIMNLDDVRGEVMGDYQQFLEEQWMEELRKEHTIKVNEKVYESVKKELSH